MDTKKVFKRTLFCLLFNQTIKIKEINDNMSKKPTKCFKFLD